MQIKTILCLILYDIRKHDKFDPKNDNISEGGSMLLPLISGATAPATPPIHHLS